MVFVNDITEEQEALKKEGFFGFFKGFWKERKLKIREEQEALDLVRGYFGNSVRISKDSQNICVEERKFSANPFFYLDVRHDVAKLTDKHYEKDVKRFLGEYEKKRPWPVRLTTDYS